jgi:hypothetical protein
MEHEKFCDILREWADIRIERDREGDYRSFAEAWAEIYHRGVSKSCLLDRMFNLDLKPSQTKCPVHQGRWSGIQWGWPGQEWVDIKTGDRRPMDVPESLQRDFDAGCRCFKHGCGCTTGWNPDEASHGPEYPR